ncbi:MAG: CRISPR-associated endoribonuclease Cas6 [Archaeoglobus sp.]|nr:MAG: CRISPR-associated endoribonuclease Cas6 [Archaeoglobus sp.]
MRLRVCLTARSNPAYLEFNHSYHLASVVYRAIERADPVLSLELHTPSAFKFFTFSRLMVEGRKFRREGDRMKLLSPNAHFFFSTLRKYIGVTFVEGLLEKPEVKIGNAEFVVSEIKVMKEKEVGRREKFVTLSPINVTTVEGNGRRRIVDLYPDNPKFYENLRKNLIKKYVAFYGREPEEDEVRIRVVSSKPVRIRLKNTFHRASLMVFIAEGSKELLEIGYKAGFGERNSMGFGMVKAV